MRTSSHLRAWYVFPGHILIIAALAAVLFLPGVLVPAGTAQAASLNFVYQTVFNGAQFDNGLAEVVDGSGNAYILAYAYDSNNDVEVVKLSPSGKILFSAYLRGSSLDYGTGLALDGNGGLWVTGYTDSADFPVVNAAQPVKDATRSGFLAKLSTTDGSILYSSFFGANRADEFHGIAIDSTGGIYLVGKTDSTNFPTLNPIQASLNLTNCFCDDAFVLHLASDAHTILFSTYLGGSSDDQGDKIGLDAAGNIYIAGITKSNDFPTVQALQPTWSGDSDVWAARISAGGSHLDYSTYLGGARTETLWGFALDPSGSLTLAGTTNSSNYPVSPGAYQITFGGGLCGAAGFGQYPCYDGFVTRLNPDGSGLAYSTFLGGNNNDEAHGITIDSTGNAFVVGYTTSSNFLASGTGIFVLSLDASGSQTRWSGTIFSASANTSQGIALGPDDDIFFTGAINAPSDLYAVRLSQSGRASPTPTPTPTNTPVPQSGGSLHVGDLDGSSSGARTWVATVEVSVHDATHQPVVNVTVRGSWTGGYSGNAQCVTTSNGACTLSTGKIKRISTNVTFTVKQLTLSGYTYDPSANHDPDGDSNGTAIKIARP